MKEIKIVYVGDLISLNFMLQYILHYHQLISLYSFYQI